MDRAIHEHIHHVLVFLLLFLLQPTAANIFLTFTMAKAESATVMCMLLPPASGFSKSTNDDHERPDCREAGGDQEIVPVVVLSPKNRRNHIRATSSRMDRAVASNIIANHAPPNKPQCTRQACLRFLHRCSCQ
uniref:Secreted protein n=1 Tax=Leersia perrieri TaxID=77586 RepID=A0A0D9X3C0_9ORYZ